MKTLSISAFCALLVMIIGQPLQPGHAVRPVKPQIELIRIPDQGIQPQAVTDERGTVHLIYLRGEAATADIYYVQHRADSDSFSAPLRVNSQPGSAIATGTIRGPHIAIGKGGRMHVAWMGSSQAGQKAPGNEAPMLYARMNDSHTAFEPQRNLLITKGGLDGGGSVAADNAGNVYVAWHGRGEVAGEDHRQVWLVSSRDDGRSFSTEKSAWSAPTGVCGCCGMRALADRAGNVYLLYRAATQLVNRDMYLLTARPHDHDFKGTKLAEWQINACPMSSAALTEGDSVVLAAWETAGQVSFTSISKTEFTMSAQVTAPGDTGKRKHPVLARNARGETLLVWTEGTGWKKGGRLAWQLFAADNRPVGAAGETDGIPVWGLAAVSYRPDGGFTIFY